MVTCPRAAGGRLVGLAHHLPKVGLLPIELVQPLERILKTLIGHLVGLAHHLPKVELRSTCRLLPALALHLPELVVDLTDECVSLRRVWLVGVTAAHLAV